MEDRDIIAMARDMKPMLVVQVFFVREGKIDRKRPFPHNRRRGMAEAEERFLASFVKQFYAGTPFMPRGVVGAVSELDDAETICLSGWHMKEGQKVKLVVPQKGEKERLVELAARNARSGAVTGSRKDQTGRAAHDWCHEPGRRSWIGLERVRRVEAYDISNTSGVESVGSMVVYEDGKPKRSDYRKFKIQYSPGTK